MLTTDIGAEVMIETLSTSSPQIPTGHPSFLISFSNFSNSSGAIPQPSGSSNLNVSVRIAYLVIGVVGTIGNLLVTVVMLSYKPLRRRLANYYLINQCVLDLVASICVIVLFSSNLSSVVDGILGEIKCRLWLNRSVFLGVLNSSLYSITALAIERYLEIVYPIQHKLRLTRRMVVYSLVATNLTGVSFKVAYLASSSVIVNGVCVDGKFPSLYIKKLVGVLNISCEFWLPLIVIGFCYVGMARSLRRKVQPMASTSFNQARKNILKTLLFIVVLFVVCNMLKEFMRILYYFNDYSTVYYNDTLPNTAVLLAYSNCCLNPLVYFFKFNEFQKGVRWLYCRCLGIKNKNSINLPRLNNEADKKPSERY